MTTNTRFTEDSYRKEPWFRAVCAALRSCRTEDELADFLRDIGTLGELQDWGERLEVAKHLARGLSYRQVAAATGASTTTVTRVAKAIENGTGGYRRVLKVHRHHRRAPSVQSAQSVQNVEMQPTTPSFEQKSAPSGNALLQKYLIGTQHKPTQDQNPR